jgi:hypothetical protein
VCSPSSCGVVAGAGRQCNQWLAVAAAVCQDDDHASPFSCVLYLGCCCPFASDHSAAAAAVRMPFLLPLVFACLLVSFCAFGSCRTARMPFLLPLIFAWGLTPGRGTLRVLWSTRFWFESLLGVHGYVWHSEQGVRNGWLGCHDRICLAWTGLLGI